jgi:hypothetical protein
VRYLFWKIGFYLFFIVPCGIGRTVKSGIYNLIVIHAGHFQISKEERTKSSSCVRSDRDKGVIYLSNSSCIKNTFDPHLQIPHIRDLIEDVRCRFNSPIKGYR